MRKCILLALTITAMAMQAIAQGPDTAWVRIYNGPGNDTDIPSPWHPAIAIDDSGYIYTTGKSIGTSSGMDYATIKYRPNGDTVWVRRYNGPGNDYDQAFSIALDHSGNVIVTGNSEGVTGYTDYATIKYGPLGNTIWTRRYDGPSGLWDDAYSVGVDYQNNVYVTGGSIGDPWNVYYYDFTTIKYDANGNQIWVRRYDGVAHGDDGAWAGLVIDSSGNVYISGKSAATPPLPDYVFDYVTVKYYPNGDTGWVRSYNGSGDSTDIPYAMAIDPQANIFVTGLSWGSTNSNDIVTVKYDSSGNLLWVAQYDGPANEENGPLDVATDSFGNSYVIGASSGVSSQYDYIVIKYFADGDTAWTHRYNGLGNWYDLPFDVATDDSGNVYVTGTSVYGSTDYDVITIKFDADGNQMWQERYTSAGNHSDAGRALALDNWGNICVSGTRGSGTSGDDYVTIKYGTAGPPPCPYLPGDINGNGDANGVDITYAVNYLKGIGPQPPIECADCPNPGEMLYGAGDVNGNCQFNGVDVTYYVNYLKGIGPALAFCPNCPPPAR